jgi:2-succinyl-5-enolpyruvyl-6-hydroxy-3-cyclohexene-1-carboxylate synthase
VLSGKHKQSSFSNWETLLLKYGSNHSNVLQVDVLITTGKMLLNKQLKNLLRETKPKKHVHIDENSYCADTFDSNPTYLAVDELSFFTQLQQDTKAFSDGAFYKEWESINLHDSSFKNDFIKSSMNELHVMRTVLNHLSKKDLVLNISNSMAIRWAAYSAEFLSENWNVFANRGVSGIDGCTSTAVGMAISKPDLPHYLITGDLAFLYDVNAFLGVNLPQNLKIIVLNNSGGGIFGLIDGPNKMKEADPYIITPHKHTCELIAKQYGINYVAAQTNEEIDRKVQTFLSYEGLSILEVFTNREMNSNIFNQYKNNTI